MRVGYATRSISSIITRHLHTRNRLKTLRRSRSASQQPHSSSTMTGKKKHSLSAVVADVTTKFGFERPEMYQSSLPGTVDPYDRHVFLCYKTHHSWPKRVETSDADPLPKTFASALRARNNDINVKTRLTVCEGGNDVKFSDGDVLVFPEMVVYRGLKESDIDSFVEDVLVKGNPWQSGVQEHLTSSYVFVCAHNNRDKRCGVCGPILIDKFKEEIVSKDLKDHVFVIACSHVGGHKYAGNVITFCADHNGKIAGNWYGYVTPGDVVDLLDIQIGKGEVIDRIWRGQMGALVKEALHVEEPKDDSEPIMPISENPPQEIAIEEKTEDVGSCCQGPNGFSCCRDEIIEETKTTEKESRGLSFSSWMDKLEQRHVLVTVAAVCSVAAVAVAYSYRRAR